LKMSPSEAPLRDRYQAMALPARSRGVTRRLARSQCPTNSRANKESSALPIYEVRHIAHPGYLGRGKSTSGAGNEVFFVEPYACVKVPASAGYGGL
jgi:hypothetical protein